MSKQSLKPRFDWIDIAKGVCISLVVLGHTINWYMRNFTEDAPIALTHFATWLQPLRMPLFFGISGLLACRKIKVPLRQLWEKTAGLYFLYLLWTGIFCIKLLLPSARAGLPYPNWDQVILAFLLPVYLWYIWALPIFYLTSWILERTLGEKSVYAIAPMALLALASDSLERAIGPIVLPPFDAVHIQNVCYNLLWFYLGLKGRDFWIELVKNSNLMKMIIALFCYLTTYILTRNLISDSEARPILTLISLLTAYRALGIINPKTSINMILSFIGRNTLPIYVMHTMLLTSLTFAVKHFKLYDQEDFLSLPFQFGIPLLISACLIFLCIAIAKVLSKTSLKFAFEPIPYPFPKKE